VQASIRALWKARTALSLRGIPLRSVTSGPEYINPFAEGDEGANTTVARERFKTSATQMNSGVAQARASVASVNRVLLVGHVGRDPVTRQLTADGSTVTLFPLATKEFTSSQNASSQVLTQWHNIAIYDSKLGEIIQNACRKGYQVYVEGRLQSRQWTDAKGVVRTHFEVAVSPFKGSVLILNKPVPMSGASEGHNQGARANHQGQGSGDHGAPISSSFRRKPDGISKDLLPEPEDNTH